MIDLKMPTGETQSSLAIYKHDQGVELGSTEKQLLLSGQSGTGTRDPALDFKPLNVKFILNGAIALTATRG